VGRSAETEPQLRIHVLGPPEVLLGDSPVTFDRNKALALLVYLAMSRQVHARDALTALLTDTPTGTDARKQLRTVLDELHRKVGDYLAIRRQTIALVPDRPIWLDLAELEAALGEDAAPADTGRLAKAVSLHQGEFLAGLSATNAPALEAWLLAEREHAHALLVRALSRLSEAAERAGDAPAAMDWAMRLLEQEPWDEAAHRRVMRLLARAGERTAALAQYVTCRRVLEADLGSAPQPETVALFEELRDGPLVPPSNLPPVLPSGFIGREAELALLADRLADPACRLLTVRGLGGCGKTSLALQAAARQTRPVLLLCEHRFADGVYQVDLAGILAPQTRGEGAAAMAARRIAVAIGRALGLEFRTADPVAHLAGWLGTRAVLLLLDNMEHLLAGADLLSLLVERCARLTLLVTSREALGVPEEWVLDLQGLPLPAAADDVEQAASGRLFLQQVRRMGRRTPPSAADRADVLRICTLTQGLPLALILAARWAAALPLAAIARELEAGLDVLSADSGYQVPERHHSMRVVLQATWARLRTLQRRALRRLAVFQPGFTREAARAVAGVRPETLLMLGEAALVGRDPAAERYALHELVRQYAAEQLARHPKEEAATRAQHAAYYAALVRQVTPALHQTDAAQEAIGADIANIRLAWDWAAERADAGILEQMLAGWATWHELQGLPGQAAEALERAAERLRTTLAWAATPDPAMQRLLGLVLVLEAFDLNWLAAYDRAHLLLEEAGTIARATASTYLAGRVAHGLGWLFARQRDLPNAQRWLEQALALARAAQEPEREAATLQRLGTVAWLAGEYARAQGYLERALALFRAQHNRYRELGVSFYLGLIAYARGDFGEAQRLLEDAQHLGLSFLLLGLVHDEGWGQHVAAEGFFAQDLRMTQETGDRMREGVALAALGRNALYQGDLERARTLLEQALSLSREVGSQGSAAMALRGQSLLAHYEGDDRHARRCAEEALEITRRAGMRREERLALRLLGHTLLGLGVWPEAPIAYEQAANLDEQLGFEHLRAETATDLARVDLAQGDTAQAASRVAAILPDLERGALEGLEEPVLAYLTGYQVLHAADDARADGVLAAGHAFLQERASQFGDEQRHAQFLENLPAHRELLAAWRARDAWTAGAGEEDAEAGIRQSVLDGSRGTPRRILRSWSS
jgi:DNA-binding SARP family transcriptional activator/predicted ATPase/Tfp pilus assembly protein PilF